VEPAASPHGHTHQHGPGHEHEHLHEQDYSHPHSHPHAHGRTIIPLEESLLAKNDLLAARNRGSLEGRGIRAFNVMSSPQAGKTTLRVRTIRELSGQLEIGVIEGDQETSLDADRIRATGRPVIQITTWAGCHLNAGMLQRGLDAPFAMTPHASTSEVLTVANRRTNRTRRMPYDWPPLLDPSSLPTPAGHDSIYVAAQS
jgi:hydrogenase nickel incorporation protein HypB